MEGDGKKRHGGKGPGLAPSDCRRRAQPTEGFSDLVGVASDDPHVAAEFVTAYASMATVERRALREAVCAESARSPIEALLAVLDAIERDVGVRPRWTAWAHEDGVAVGTPELGTLELRRGRLAIRDGCGPREGASPLDVDHAVDLLAKAMWRGHLEGQPWPAGAARFAALFDR